MEAFKPIYSKESKILILGSFPSVKSRLDNFYYANPHNRFWKMMEQLFNVELATNEDKTKFILENNFALWDIVENCEIKGSLDTNIKNVEFANLKLVLPPNTKVNKILCNGKKSFSLTTKYLLKENLNIETIYVPSTSPANTSFDMEVWKKELL